MNKILLLTVVLYSITVNVFAADKNGHYAIRGAGIIDCETFEKERVKKSPEYLMIGGWMDGYITARNQFQKDTYDLMSFESTEMIAIITSNYCKKHPKERLFTVINSVMAKIHDRRIQERSLKDGITVDGKRVMLYQETLMRIQNALIKLGFYKGKLTSKFDKNTMAAIKKYQASIKFQQTGYPDQLTLWKLLGS